jgi:hypothetical protein
VYLFFSFKPLELSRNQLQSAAKRFCSGHTGGAPALFAYAKELL